MQFWLVLGVLFGRDLVGHNVRNVAFAEMRIRLETSQALSAQICPLGICDSKLCNRNVFFKKNICCRRCVFHKLLLSCMLQCRLTSLTTLLLLLCWKVLDRQTPWERNRKQDRKEYSWSARKAQGPHAVQPCTELTELEIAGSREWCCNEMSFLR